jgi:hypothetical protein
MMITRTSPFSKKSITLNIPKLTPELLNRIENRNCCIQDVPGAMVLTASEREFIMTGIPDEEWDKFLSDK